jgi:hypothetical protein
MDRIAGLDRRARRSGVSAIKAKGKRQKAKGKSTEKNLSFRTFAFCLLPFAFCLDRSGNAPALLLQP